MKKARVDPSVAVVVEVKIRGDELIQKLKEAKRGLATLAK